MPTFLIVTAAAAAFVAWFYVGIMRVHSGRAKSLVEGMTPQRIVYLRLSRQIRRQHGDERLRPDVGAAGNSRMCGAA